MRFLAAELAGQGARNWAGRLLDMTEQLPSIRQSERIRAFRSELLEWRLTPKLQDDLAAILTQLRALEYGLEG